MAGVAEAIGGDHVAVTSILSNPDEDPHLFEASPSVARNLAAAKIVIANGADYDPWVAKLLAANSEPDRAVIVAARSRRQEAGRQSAPLVRPRRPCRRSRRRLPTVWTPSTRPTRRTTTPTSRSWTLRCGPLPTRPPPSGRSMPAPR
ncbi:MAG: zinc ABC transporter substrate-binding protein [Bauldia sp.]